MWLFFGQGVGLSWGLVSHIGCIVEDYYKCFSGKSAETTFINPGSATTNSDSVCLGNTSESLAIYPLPISIGLNWICSVLDIGRLWVCNLCCWNHTPLLNFSGNERRAIATAVSRVASNRSCFFCMLVWTCISMMVIVRRIIYIHPMNWSQTCLVLQNFPPFSYWVYRLLQ